MNAPRSLDWLTKGERARYDSFSGPGRRDDFLAGRWLLRNLLASLRGGTAADHPADVDEEGRSRLARGHANLSHSGDWIACAVADFPIGTDIESLRPRRDFLGIAERVASPAECAQLARLEGAAQLEAFYRLWTLREAWLKRRGRGLDLHQMQELHFEANAHGDLACALLPQARLMLALDVENLGDAELPDELAGEVLVWQRFSAGPAS